MTPVLRLYWLMTLVVLPLSLWGLLASAGGDYSFGAFLAQPVPLFLSLLSFVWAVCGGYDVFLSTSNLRRLYPVLANARYLLEFFRPEIQQYFISNNIEERPFSRERRNIIYRRAKGESDTIPFGTEQNILEEGYRTLLHSLKPVEVDESHGRVLFGGPDCAKPYSASRLNISAMSFGALSGNAIQALNKGARLGGFAHNTGEGSLSPHHLQHGGDIIWQIGTGYFGCRHKNGRFNDEAFAERAVKDVVKMVEIKISQGAKPSHGGVLPGAKVSREIADIRLVEVGQTVLSPPNHPEFDTPVGLLEFVQRLRELSGGKPIGFKLAIGLRYQFNAILKAMLETGILPDFITVDGSEGGTGAAPAEFTNRFGEPCLEGTFFVDQMLKGANLRDRIRIISSGMTGTGFDLLEKVAVGADTVNAARSMMLAIGCIQARSCNTNHCPTGITTQDPARSRAVDVESKAVRVKTYHHATVESFLELCGAMGFSDPDELKPEDLLMRHDGGVRSYADINVALQAGQLLGNDIPEKYLADWQRADSASF